MVPVLEDFPVYKSILKPMICGMALEWGDLLPMDPEKTSERRACLSEVLKGQ